MKKLITLLFLFVSFGLNAHICFTHESRVNCNELYIYNTDNYFIKKAWDNYQNAYSTFFDWFANVCNPKFYKPDVYLKLCAWDEQFDLYVDIPDEDGNVYISMTETEDRDHFDYLKGLLQDNTNLLSATKSVTYRTGYLHKYKTTVSNYKIAINNSMHSNFIWFVCAK